MNIYSSRWDNQFIGNIELTNSQNISLVYKNSREAFLSRKTTPISQRLLYISQFLDIYISRRDEIARSITLEIGKPITQSLADVDYDIWYIQRFLDHAADILTDQIIFEDNQSKHIMKYDPIWVMAVISPWNYPTSQRVWQIIPTLIAGNTVVYKPSSACMYTAHLLNQILQSILPKDVFQYIYGGGDLWDILTLGDCDGIIFTWSTKVWQHIATIASQKFKKTFLELWWSAPAIITDSAKIDHNMMLSFDYFRRRHAWQICDGIKRVIIHSSKYDEFMNYISDHLSHKHIWNPLDPKTDIWPLISQKQLDILQSQLQDAISKLAQIHQFGNYDNTDWYFIKPIILTNVTLDMQVMQEETFWPILPLYIYSDLEEAAHIANSTKYGLWWYIWSENSSDIQYLSDNLNTWNISINNTSYLIPQVPFGWYTASSGNIRAHGYFWLRELCNIKSISSPK